jgi:hypothetical protein
MGDEGICSAVPNSVTATGAWQRLPTHGRTPRGPAGGNDSAGPDDGGATSDDGDHTKRMTVASQVVR